MTDARLPERYLTDRRLLLLDVPHRWSYVASLVWSVANRTDGVILPEELGLIPGFSGGSPKALIDANLWKALPSGWEIIDFTTTQTSAHELEVLENVRRNNRKAKVRERAKKAEGKPPPPPPSHRDSQPDVSMTGQSDDTGEERTGQARTGLGQEVLRPTTSESSEHPEPEPPLPPSPKRPLSVVPDRQVTPDSWPELAATGTGGRGCDLIDHMYDREF